MDNNQTNDSDNKTKESDNIIYYNININELYAKTEICQSFTNTTNYAIELQLDIPVFEDIQISNFEAKIGEKKIVSKVVAKQIAEEKYYDSIAKGNQAIISKYNEEDSIKRLTFVIGNLDKNEKIILTTTFLQKIESYDLSYQFKTFFDFPIFIDSKRNVLQDLSKNNVECKIVLETNSKITRFLIKDLDSSEKILNKKFNEQKNKCEVLYKNNCTKSQPFYIVFRTEKINSCKLFEQYDNNLNETNYILQYINSPNEINIKNENDEIDEDNSIIYKEKYLKNIESNKPALFIFLVDQSGSMMGNRIKIVKQSLIMFLHSLPKNSYFQIIGFGSGIKYYNEGPVIYDKENVISSQKLVEKIEADMGGTNIFDPLNKIFSDKSYDDIKLPKNIFLLTDGEVEDRDDVLEKILLNKNRFIVHAVGIGDSFDKILIKKAGEYGQGSYNYIQNLDELNKTIIKIVEQCLNSYINEISFEVLNNKNEIEDNKNINFCYENNIINYSFIMKNKNENEIDIKMKYKNDGKECEDNFKFNKDNIIKINDGNILNKLIIGNYINNNKLKVKKEIELAKKYQVLTNNTSMFAELQNDKNISEIKQIKVLKHGVFDHCEKLEDLDKNFMLKQCLMEMEYEREMSDKNEVRIIKELEYDDRPKRMEIDDLAYTIKDIETLKKEEEKRRKEEEEKRRKEEEEKGRKEEESSKPDRRREEEEKRRRKEEEMKRRFEMKNKEEDNKKKEKDEFNLNKIILTQDILDGCWNKNDETEKVKDRIKEIFDKINDYLIKTNAKNLELILYTFIMIYYIENYEKDKIGDFKLILNKGKSFLKEQNYLYENIIKDNNL